MITQPLARKRKSLPILAAALSLAACLLAATPATRADGPPLPNPDATTADNGFKLPPTVTEIDDIRFGMGDDRPLYLNIIRPAKRAAAPAPAVIWIHGGGWHSGNRYSGRCECAYLAQRGYVCASIDYRLSQDFVWPAQIEDCKCAVRYLRAHSAQLGIDPAHIGVWGDSAGGHLAALLGTAGGVAELEGVGGSPATSSRVQAVCDWFGPTDIAQMQAQGSDLNPDDPLSPPALLFGTGGLAAHKDAVQQANPCAYATPDDAPALIVHGAADTTVPLAQSQLLVDALHTAHVPVTLDVLPGAVHEDAAFVSSAVLQTCAQFFDKWLKKPLPAKADLPEDPSALKGTSPKREGNVRL